MLGLTSEIAKTRSHMTFNNQNRNRNILDLYGIPTTEAISQPKHQNAAQSALKTNSHFQIDSELKEKVLTAEELAEYSKVISKMGNGVGINKRQNKDMTQIMEGEEQEVSDSDSKYVQEEHKARRITKAITHDNHY